MAINYYAEIVSYGVKVTGKKTMYELSLGMKSLSPKSIQSFVHTPDTTGGDSPNDEAVCGDWDLKCHIESEESEDLGEPDGTSDDAAEDQASPVVMDDIERNIFLESQIRICDLIQAKGLITEAEQCWVYSLYLFPESFVAHNELANVLVKVCLWCCCICRSF